MEIAPGEGDEGDIQEGFSLRIVPGRRKTLTCLCTFSGQEPQIQLVFTPVPATYPTGRSLRLHKTVGQAQRTMIIYSFYSVQERWGGGPKNSKKHCLQMQAEIH